MPAISDVNVGGRCLLIDFIQSAKKPDSGWLNVKGAV
jgi:hypothetical protein